MPKPLMRIPYTGPLPPPRIIPQDATTVSGAVTALLRFLTAESSFSLSSRSRTQEQQPSPSTVVLTGAGISVASGLADYRGANGTYVQNKSYRPTYFHEFVRDHEARKRYWARSFLGWTILDGARPNATHWALKRLGEMGLESLSRLNPAWAAFLAEVVSSGALQTENPEEKRARGLKTNPDGDVDLPDAPYTTFRYPACPSCLAKSPLLLEGEQSRVDVDADGAWLASSTAGILKPGVVMFGESISEGVKLAAERAVDDASRILVIGTSLATYSAWRLVRRAKERRMPIGILNLGGVRGEEGFFQDLPVDQKGDVGVRLEMAADQILPLLLEELQKTNMSRL
ncbi:MAG: hypothetical protein M1816_007000 [Peltula sp. TS41687]|nr:MAG: hypothetical protein M1816_007000 [Peltula sp. TS41687]